MAKILKLVLFAASLIASAVIGLSIEDRRPGTFDRLLGRQSNAVVEPDDHNIIVGARNIIIDPSAYEPKAVQTAQSTDTPAPRLNSPEVLETLNGIAMFLQGGSGRFEIKQDGFLNGDIKNVTLVWDTQNQVDVDIRLRDGVAYSVEDETCPSVLSGDGTCEIKIKMDAPGAGTFKDALDVISGDNRIATVNLSGLDERPVELDFVFTPDSQQSVIKQDSETDGTEISMQLWLMNAGDIPAQIHTVGPVVFDDYGRDWKKNGGSCMTRVVPSGSACSVDYTIKVRHSVPFTSRFAVSRNHRRNLPDNKTASVSVHVSGIHADIPNTIKLGDPCPEKGQTAEVLVLADTSRLSGLKALPVINTATCVWQHPADDGRQRCDSEKTLGTQHHVATLKRYRFDNGKWERTEVRQGHVTPFLSCTQGVIKEVRYTW